MKDAVKGIPQAMGFLREHYSNDIVRITATTASWLRAVNNVEYQEHVQRLLAGLDVLCSTCPPAMPAASFYAIQTLSKAFSNLHFASKSLPNYIKIREAGYDDFRYLNAYELTNLAVVGYITACIHSAKTEYKEAGMTKSLYLGACIASPSMYLHTQVKSTMSLDDALAVVNNGAKRDAVAEIKAGIEADYSPEPPGNKVAVKLLKIVGELTAEFTEINSL